jgi:hypothetical protein
MRQNQVPSKRGDLWARYLVVFSRSISCDDRWTSESIVDPEPNDVVDHMAACRDGRNRRNANQRIVDVSEIESCSIA